MSDVTNEEELLVTYLRYGLAQREEDFWAFQQIVMESRLDPLVSWERIQRLLVLAANEAELSYIAAGTLEDLLTNFPDWTIARISEQIPTNRRLAFAITQVWVKKESNAYQQIENLLEQYNLRNVNPLICEIWP